MLSTEATWTESYSVAPLKLKKPVLYGVLLHVSTVSAIMILGSNSNLVLSGNILFGIVTRMNSA